LVSLRGDVGYPALSICDFSLWAFGATLKIRFSDIAGHIPYKPKARPNFQVGQTKF